MAGIVDCWMSYLSIEEEDFELLVHIPYEQ